MFGKSVAVYTISILAILGLGPCWADAPVRHSAVKAPRLVTRSFHLSAQRPSLWTGQAVVPRQLELRLPGAPIGPITAQNESAGPSEHELMLDPERGWSNTFRNQARVPFSFTLLPLRF